MTPEIIGPGRVAMDDRPGEGALRRLSLGRRGRRRGRRVRRPRVGLSARAGRKPAVRDRGGDGLEELDLGGDRAGDRGSSELFPNRTNVSFWTAPTAPGCGRGSSSAGVGETLSSGTGASGAAVAAFLRGAASPVTVVLDGGELTVEISDDLSCGSPETPSPCTRARSPERGRCARGCARLASQRRGPDRSLQAPRGDPAVHVRGARAQGRRQDGVRDRRDQPRHRGSGHADLPARRRGDAGRGGRPRQPELPVQPWSRGVPRGVRALLRDPLRGRRSTRRPR